MANNSANGRQAEPRARARDELRRDGRGGRAARAGRRRAASCPTSCARSGRSIARSAAWCRRSPPARTSNASTSWCAKRCARPTPASAILTPSPRRPGPGLIGGLIVGAITGKAIALARGLPFIAVHHLEAHALTVGLTEGIAPPYLLLLVSGGHTQLLIVRGVGHYERLGTTIDDALGEAFDKTAKLLGLGFPGGPAVEQIARQRRCAPLRPAAADARARGAAFLLRRPEDGGAAHGREAQPAAASRTSPTSPPPSRPPWPMWSPIAARARMDIAATRLGRLAPLRFVVAGGVAANAAPAREPARAGASARLLLPCAAGQRCAATTRR